MTAYLQMGHHSQNLLNENDLAQYKGAVLSPVNEDENCIQAQINAHQGEGFEMIFDSQLYYPNAERGRLPEWSYFPSDVESADRTSLRWWRRIITGLKQTALRIHPQAICSPALVPQVYNDNYYTLNQQVAEIMKDRFTNTGIDILQTLIVNLTDITEETRPAEIASIATSGPLDRVFLVLKSDTEPRRELSDTEQIKGAMKLIRYLEQSGVRVLVGFSSSDLILWKFAGAQDCASGKYFNLRRFTPSRFEPSPDGGGQVWYWFEESMMAYLREPDLLRIRRANLLPPASMTNPFSIKILNQIDTQPEVAWLGLSWRQYLYWFSEFERRFTQDGIDANSFLANAETIWNQLEDLGILMEERRNDGNWLRSWRRAVLEAFRVQG